MGFKSLLPIVVEEKEQAPRFKFKQRDLNERPHTVEEGDVRKIGLVGILNLIILIGGILVGGGIKMGSLETRVDNGILKQGEAKKEILTAIKGLSTEMRTAAIERNNNDRRGIRNETNITNLVNRLNRSVPEPTYKAPRKKKRSRR